MDYTDKNRKVLVITLLGALVVTVSVSIAIYYVRSRSNSTDSTLQSSNQTILVDEIKIDRERIVENIRANYDNAVNQQGNEIPGKYYIDDNSFNTSITYDQIVDNLPNHSLQQVGWIPAWAYKSGYTTFTQTYQNFNSVSPVWYKLNDEGEIVEDGVGNWPQLKKFARSNGIDVVPTIASFSFSQFKAAVGSEEKLKSHTDQLYQIVIDNDYDGIDLDYESIELVDKAAYHTLIKDLGERLRAKNKILSVTVLSKWGDNVVYPSLVETRQVQDWKYISEHADQVRIMTYDFTHPSSGVPGPIAPTDWMVAVMEYAVQRIPRDKLWLGIHLYSYEWSSDGESHSYFYDTVQQIISQEGVNLTYDELSNESIASYSCGDDTDTQGNTSASTSTGETSNDTSTDGVPNSDTESSSTQDFGKQCILYYASPESVEARKNIAKHFRIAGVAYWSLGKNTDLVR